MDPLCISNNNLATGQTLPGHNILNENIILQLISIFCIIIIMGSTNELSLG